MQKYGFDDARDVLERASARETAARVVAGSLAKALLATIDVEILSHVVRIGAAAVPKVSVLSPVTLRLSMRVKCAASMRQPRPR